MRGAPVLAGAALGAKVWVYVPYAPAVVEKYGVDAATGLPRCSGPDPPPGLTNEGGGQRARAPAALRVVSDSPDLHRRVPVGLLRARRGLRAGVRIDDVRQAAPIIYPYTHPLVLLIHPPRFIIIVIVIFVSLRSPNRFKWTPYWLSERELARPWVHQRQYVQIDRILAEHVPRYFLHRKLESEYATLFLEEKGAGAD